MKLQWETIPETEITQAKRYRSAYEEVTRADSPSLVRKSSLTVTNKEGEVIPTFHPTPGVTILDIFVKEGAKASFTYLQDNPESEHCMTILKFHVNEGASLDFTAGVFGAQAGSLFIETYIQGAHAHFTEKVIFFGNGTQHFDMFSNTEIQAPDANVHVECRGILADKAVARFDGGITIRSNGKGSNGKLLEHTLLLSPDAKMSAVPGLLIETNDVQAGHAASMTRVDDEQIFYLNSRGIDESEAIKLIANGFLAELFADHSEEKAIEALMREKICQLN